MIDLTVARIAEIVGGTLADISPDAAAECHVTGTVEFDSRAVGPGGLFLALPGGALRRTRPRDIGGAAGAVVVLAARPVGVPAIVVSPQLGDPGPGCSSTTPTGRARRCWPRWPSWPRRWPPELVAGGLIIIGITGSSGKTSTKDLVAAVLGAAG